MEKSNNEIMIDERLVKRSALSEARCQVIHSNINGHDTYIFLYAVGYPVVRQWFQLQRSGAYYHWTYIKKLMPEATDREQYDVTQAMEAMGFDVGYNPEFLEKMVEWGDAAR